jgi:hypothetical protein
MGRYDAFMLRIWRSTAVGGRQWTARLEHLPDGQRLRFTDPEALLAHLEAIMREVDHPAATADQGGKEDDGRSG